MKLRSEGTSVVPEPKTSVTSDHVPHEDRHVHEPPTLQPLLFHKYDTPFLCSQRDVSQLKASKPPHLFVGIWYNHASCYRQKEKR